MGLEIAAIGTQLTHMSKPPLKDQRLQLVVDREFVAAVDAWRRKQPELPSRSEAIRRLVAMSLKQEDRK